MTDAKNEGACGASRSDAVLDRAAKLRADLDYVAAYLESAVEGERESGLLMSGECLLADVLEFLARDNAERPNK